MDLVPASLPQENLGSVYDKALEGLGSWMSIELIKVCKKCGEIKWLERFSLDKRASDGKRGACKECQSKEKKEYRQRPEVKDRIKIQNKVYNQKPEVKAKKRQYAQKPEVKALAKEYRQKPKSKARKKELGQTPEAKARTKKRKMEPEVKAKIRIYAREYNQKPKRKAYLKRYGHEYHQKPEVKARINDQTRKRRATDLNFRIAENLRSRGIQAIKNGAKGGSFVDDLCCSIDEFKAKVAKFFKPGMSWKKNWGKGPGKWHLDHIVPLSWFDLTNREQFKSAAHYSNYQPLWEEENFAKGDRYQMPKDILIALKNRKRLE
jgi:hypothetical protein